MNVDKAGDRMLKFVSTAFELCCTVAFASLLLGVLWSCCWEIIIRPVLSLIMNVPELRFKTAFGLAVIVNFVIFIIELRNPSPDEDDNEDDVELY
jgi:hypothetical protein